MSALGQKQTYAMQKAMSALPPIADIRRQVFDVCFVPKAVSCSAANKYLYSITSSAVTSNVCGTARPRVLAGLVLRRKWPSREKTGGDDEDDSRTFHGYILIQHDAVFSHDNTPAPLACRRLSAPAISAANARIVERLVHIRQNGHGVW
jgi:hypothetical protein